MKNIITKKAIEMYPEREKQIKDIDKTIASNKKKRLKLINDYKSVEKLMEE